MSMHKRGLGPILGLSWNPNVLIPQASLSGILKWHFSACALGIKNNKVIFESTNMSNNYSINIIYMNVDLVSPVKKTM
jgi:hypothetical protein